jgi:hypothetical protein
MKTFSLDEAQTLLPVLESLLRRAVAANAKAAALEAELQALNQRIFLSGGMNVDVATIARRRGEREMAIREAKDSINEIDSIGVQVKDLNSGLLDFPCMLDGEIVLLCWRLGEKQITHWHTLDGGFASRRPLDDRFRGEKLQ